MNVWKYEKVRQVAHDGPEGVLCVVVPKSKFKPGDWVHVKIEVYKTKERPRTGSKTKKGVE